MSSLLFRRRISRGLLPDHTDFYYSMLESKLRTSYGIYQCSRKVSISGMGSKFDFMDLRRPHTWYPAARKKKKRNVVLHVGPTNSGKTYHALKRLESSTSGIYCGPLRLLAWEVAQRLNKANVPCNLITGQEREEIDGARHKSVIVEMSDLKSDYSCAVIDEIQMLGCKTRGYSFTRALLGLCVDELHLCGDPAAVPLVQEILKVTDDVVEVQHYERLSPLVPLNVPLGSLSNATMFNDENSDFDVLVASDAIGMGLNLNIYRIIFSSVRKFDGSETRDLTVSEIKQIAGRAGRYKSIFPVGEVTCLNAEDLPLVHSALNSPSPILEQAGLFPTYDLIVMFSRLHPTYGLQQILEHYVENAKLSENYFIANCEEMLKVAAVIDKLPLTLNDKYLFLMSPVEMENDISYQGLIQFATSYCKNKVVRLKEIFSPGTLKIPKSHKQLKELESIHKVLDLYVWLSFQMDDSFPDRELAASQKAICSMLIEQFLVTNGFAKAKLSRPNPISNLTQDLKSVLTMERKD